MGALYKFLIESRQSAARLSKLFWFIFS